MLDVFCSSLQFTINTYLYSVKPLKSLTLSLPHVTIVAISPLVKKVPSQELLHATEFSMRLV